MKMNMWIGICNRFNIKFPSDAIFTRSCRSSGGNCGKILGHEFTSIFREGAFCTLSSNPFGVNSFLEYNGSVVL